MNVKPCPKCQGSGYVPDKRRKLSDEDRASILARLDAGELATRLAIEYDVSDALISRGRRDWRRA